MVGGVDANIEAVSLIECYDPKTNKWSVVGKTKKKKKKTCRLIRFWMFEI